MFLFVAKCCVVLCCVTLDRAVLFCFGLCYWVVCSGFGLHGVVLCCVVLRGFVLCCVVMWCVRVFCWVLYCVAVV